MATWEWKSGDTWVPFDSKSNEKIIKAVKKNKKEVEITIPSGAKYLVDLVNNRQIQKNSPTRTRRVRFNDGSLPRTKPKVVHVHTETTTVAAPSPPVAVQQVQGNMFYTTMPSGPAVQTMNTVAPMQPIQMAPMATVQPMQQPVMQQQMPLQGIVHTQAPPPSMQQQMAPPSYQQPQYMPTNNQPMQYPQQTQMAPPAYNTQYQTQQAPPSSGIEWNQQFATNQMMAPAPAY